MSSFDPPRAIVVRAVEAALVEDVGVLGDITTLACVDEDQAASAVFMARADGVLAGTALATETYRQVDDRISVEWTARDGDPVAAGSQLGCVSGRLRSILTGERTALNFLCHCSGIATATHRYVVAAHGKVRVLDTRKTIPGLRELEKQAVKAGGGENHRRGLYDQVLIKENHIAMAGGVGAAVRAAREHAPALPLEVEVRTPREIDEALAAGATRLLLDNMDPDELHAAVAQVDGRALLEASGGITLDTLRAVGATGVDFVSMGSLTQSAAALDLSLLVELV